MSASPALPASLGLKCHSVATTLLAAMVIVMAGCSKRGTHQEPARHTREIKVAEPFDHHPGFVDGEEIGMQPDDGTITIESAVHDGRWFTEYHDHVVGGFYHYNSLMQSDATDYALFTPSGKNMMSFRVFNINQVEKKFDLGYLLLEVVILLEPDGSLPETNAMREKLNFRRFASMVQVAESGRQGTMIIRYRDKGKL